MKRACDVGAGAGAAALSAALPDVLRHATAAVGELRTSSLTPKVYYELYMDVFDVLTFLEAHFAALQRAGVPLARVYEAVQLTGNVLPRVSARARARQRKRGRARRK